MKKSEYINLLFNHKCAQCGKDICILSTAEYGWKCDK